MATTHRQLINRVLRVLGEDEVSSSVSELTSDYHKLVATFVNQIREEVEDSHQWRRLRHTESVTIAASTNSATIPNTNERSRLYRDDGITGLVFDVTLPGSVFPIVEADLATLLYQRTSDNISNNQLLSWFAIDDLSGDTIDLQVYPTPLSERTISVTMITPQDRFGDADSDNPGLDTTILVPVRPIELGALWYALEERGEELGVRSTFTEAKYRQALDDAISRDAAEQGLYDLVPV